MNGLTARIFARTVTKRSNLRWKPIASDAIAAF